MGLHTFEKAGLPVRGAPYEYIVSSALPRADRKGRSPLYAAAGSEGVSEGFSKTSSSDRPQRPVGRRRGGGGNMMGRGEDREVRKI
jgi:hypothetical protein